MTPRTRVLTLTRLTIAGALVVLSALGLGVRPAVAAAKPHAARTAALSVKSDPDGASVYVDGRFVGQTPIDVASLSVGDHRVRVVQDGYLEHRRVVRITGAKAETLHVRLTARAVRGAQAAGLKIVVIAGEDGVNIIQQKTAVNPIVEVRDRNDLPVTGVPVTFTIAGPNATFGSGLQTVTVTTNAAGRAAATSLTPVSPGQIQIQVTASSQGQTAAVSITQTNFATAAAAAQAGAMAGGGAAGTAGTAAAAGAGAGAGGGLSGAAIAAIVGGAGAAAVVGAKAAGLFGAASCTFFVGPDGRPQPITVSSTSTTQTVAVSTEPDNCEPNTWSATSNAPFITVTTDATTAFLHIEANPPGNPARTGTVTIAGQTVTVTQGARCAYSVTPLLVVFPAAGGTATLSVTITPPVCEGDEWMANAGNPFVTVNPAGGRGSAVVTLTAPPNPFPFERAGTMAIAFQSVLYRQLAAGGSASPPGPAGAMVP